MKPTLAFNRLLQLKGRGKNNPPTEPEPAKTNPLLEQKVAEQKSEPESIDSNYLPLPEVVPRPLIFEEIVSPQILNEKELIVPDAVAVLEPVVEVSSSERHPIKSPLDITEVRIQPTLAEDIIKIAATEEIAEPLRDNIPEPRKPAKRPRPVFVQEAKTKEVSEEVIQPAISPAIFNKSRILNNIAVAPEAATIYPDNEPELLAEDFTENAVKYKSALGDEDIVEIDQSFFENLIDTEESDILEEFLVEDTPALTLEDLPAPIQDVRAAAIQFEEVLKVAEPEIAQEIQQIIEIIMTLPDQLKVEGIKDEAIIEAKLEELFIKLFEVAGIEYSPELIESFVKLTRAHHLAELLPEPPEEAAELPAEQGTREFIQMLQGALSSVRQTVAGSLQIGRSVLLLCGLTTSN